MNLIRRAALVCAVYCYLGIVLVRAGDIPKIDPAAHKACMNARDYIGCIQAHTGRGSPGNGGRPEVGDKMSALENSCPAAFGYIGAGYCRNIYCDYQMFGVHDRGLGGKGWACDPGQILRWGDQTVRAVHDPSCPSFSPSEGWNNSCEQELHKDAISNDIKGHVK